MRRLTLCLPFLALAAPGQAFEKLDGYLIATKTCELLQSKNKGTNPGDLETEVMRAYEMIGTNKVGGDHYQVRVPGAPVTEDRWVFATCGTHVVAVGGGPVSPPPPPPPVQPTTEESTNNLLALSWQPAFCESGAGRSKPECKALNDGHLSHAATQFSIHGLWPQPRGVEYCGVPEQLKQLDKAKRWSDLPALDLTADTRDALNVAMPGTQSDLQRHEWYKHGSCFGDNGAEGYFVDTLAITDAINNSAIGDFMETHVGTEVEMNEIRVLFDQVFGDGAGDAVTFACKNDGDRFLLTEMRVALMGTIDHTDPDGFGALLQDATRLPEGCKEGIIDPAGLQ